MIWDVIVVGAGAAGLAAAGELARRGRRVLLVEARTRVGGRMWTAKAQGREVIELGPEFVHGGNPEFFRMLRRIGVKPTEMAMRMWRRGEGGFVPADDVWDRVAEVMAKLGVDRAGRKPLGQLWKEKAAQVGISAEEAELTKRFVEGFEAAPFAEMSARAMGMLEEEERQWNLPQGYGAVAKGLAEAFLDAGGVLALGRKVRQVRWEKGGKGGVDVSLDRGAPQRARVVVITVPPAVEQEIRFSPALPKRRGLLRRAGLGVVRRVTLEMKGSFWAKGKLPQGFIHAPGADFPTWWTRNPGVTAWRGGPGAKDFAGMSPAEVRRRAVRTLAGLIGCRAKDLDRQVKACWSHDWAEDPLTRGAYSYARGGADEALPVLLAKPIGGVLYFAGEATADLAALGTVHGAHATGLRAAREVLAARRGLLWPGSLTPAKSVGGGFAAGGEPKRRGRRSYGICCGRGR